jgi:alginate O-acetyltransferase complex protein AlgJ
MKKYHTRLHNWFLVLAVILLAILPFCLQFSGVISRGVSFEKRDLAQRPSLFMSSLVTEPFIKRLQDFPEEFELYLKDHFPLRNRVIQLTTFLKLKYLKTLSSSRVYIGKNGFYYYNDENFKKLASSQNLLSKEELDKYLQSFKKRQEYLKSKNIPYYIFISPIKDTIYPENLPNGYPGIDDFRRADQLVKHVRENSDIKIVYFKDVLLAAKKSDPDLQLYYKTDSHWNSNGSFLAYQELSKQLQLVDVSIVPFAKSDFDITTKNDSIGDLSALIGVGNLLTEQNEPVYTPKGDIRITSTSELSSYLGSDLGQNSAAVESRLLKSNNPNGKKLLLFNSSFSDSLRQFVGLHFTETQLLKYTVSFDTKAVEEFKPDIVVQEFSEQSLFDMPMDNL